MPRTSSTGWVPRTSSTAATVEAALDAIDAVPPALAMLDINLGDRTSFPIAHRLNDLGIPLLFATGYGEQAQLPMEHRSRIGRAEALHARDRGPRRARTDRRSSGGG